MFGRCLPRFLLGLSLMPLVGCASPYHSDRGALFGGLLGAGTGAVVGNAVGNTAAGAALGAGVGALSGAAVGAGMDESEARNRQLIEERTAQQAVAGALTVPEVVNMTRANVDEELIINQVRARGLAAPVQSADVIYLQQQGVSKGVIAAMQTQPVAVRPSTPVYAAPAPVIVEEYWGPPGMYYYRRPHCHAPPPHVGVGFSFSSR